MFVYDCPECKRSSNVEDWDQCPYCEPDRSSIACPLCEECSEPNDLKERLVENYN